MTRGDGTPMPRRRSTPLATMSFDEEPRATTVQRPRARHAVAGRHDRRRDARRGRSDHAAAADVGKRPYAIYGIAGGGMLLGLIGLVVGLRSGEPSAHRHRADRARSQRR